MTSGTAPAGAPSRQVAERRFSQSMIVSGTRCLLAYVVFPYVFPLLGRDRRRRDRRWAWPSVSWPIVFNVAEHPAFLAGGTTGSSGHLSVVNLAVMGLMFYLAVGDVAELAG